jgi:hypothetical protein
MREQYIQMRRTGQYDFGWFYQYYLQQKINNTRVIPFELFIQAFRTYFQFSSQDIIQYLDGKFEIQKIEDQNSNLIYIN